MKKEWGDQQIRDYLLGRLPEAEMEELDELSIADDEFALRRQAAENELLDSYLKNEISEQDLSSFKTHYLNYIPRRKKILTARAFHSLLEKEKGKEVSSRNVVFQQFPWLAAAAIVLLLLTGYLAYENIQMRRVIAQGQAELQTLRARELELRKQVDMKRSGEQESETLIAMNLPPATRGLGKIPVLEVPAGTDSAMLTLELETNRYPGYQVEIRDPATNEVLWQSERLNPGKTIPVKVPVSVFRTQQYQLELYGISASGGTEIVAGYPVTVIRK